MSRICTICSHQARGAIDRALVESAPNRRVAAQYGLSEQAVRRHRAAHLPSALVGEASIREVARADSLFDQLHDLQEKTQGILEKAEKAGEMRTALAAIRETRGNLELLTKIYGEIQASQAQQPESEIPPELVEVYLTKIKPLGYDQLQDLVKSLRERIDALTSQALEEDYSVGVRANEKSESFTPFSGST